ncbi:hypothetical protein P3X46_027551 [Hevea brasiliensis]|uniref:Uncharacterized protein n=1 Tax=Hevea brasiliensis TaxID=3981 RepID=A0ABQ9L1B3_HEVBR|nr:hypothetical protein P3X46_027551 [Hevea brasiliensis]
MGFFSFLGRVLFAWQMFYVKHGCPSSCLVPLKLFKKCSLSFVLIFHLTFTFGEDGGPATKELIPKLGPGGFLSIFGTPFGAYLLSVALFGALLFFIGMKNLIPRRQIKKNSPKAKVG